MYIVCINDYTTGKQTVVHKIGYFNEAKDICKETALQIVLKKEGEKYMQKTPWLRTKSSLLKGYNLVKSESIFHKYVIYEKDPNGIFYAGGVKKLYSVFIVKVPHTVVPEQRFYTITEEVQLNLEAVFLEIISASDPKESLSTTREGYRYGLKVETESV